MKIRFKKKRRFLTSIRVKFMIVYILVNILSLQLIGLYFTTQVKKTNIQNFQDAIIEQEKNLNYNIMDELTKVSSSEKEQEKIRASIKKMASEFVTANIITTNIVDQNLDIIASSSKNKDVNYLGKKAVDPLVSQVLKTGNTASKEQINENKKIYWTYVSPIKNGEQILGVIYVTADIQKIYDDTDDIIRTFMIATVLSIFVTTMIGFLASKTVTNAIEKMSDQVRNMAEGNYGEVIGIKTNDEIGDLARVFNQISKRIKEEQSINEIEKRKLSALINSMKDGIIATDSSGKITLINDSAITTLGVKRSDIFIGKDIIKILNITEYSSIREIIEAEDSLLISVGDKKDEELHRIEITEVSTKDVVDNVFSSQKELDGYIVVLYDVTESEKEEAERREFVSTVSHELRTPLTTMNSYIEALNEGVMEDKALAKTFIQTIQNETKRMIRMVKDLMQLGKMDIKEEHYDMEFIDINKMLENITERFKMTHPEKNFVLQLKKDPVFVEADQDKLTQVFDNIINNAIKYSPNGKNITLRIRQNYNQNRIIVSIKDEGIGIPLANIDKIFNRFYRVDKSRQRSMGGTGLGLSLAKSIVEAHRGKIWAQSREGYGSIIYVMLPSEEVIDEWE